MTWHLVTKTLVSAVVIVAASEIAKRTSFWGAVLASLPLTSLLTFIWLYVDTGDTGRIASLSQGIFWLVLASLPLLLLLPALLRNGWAFWPSLVFGCAVTTGTYFGLVWLLGVLGIRL